MKLILSTDHAFLTVTKADDKWPLQPIQRQALITGALKEITNADFGEISWRLLGERMLGNGEPCVYVALDLENEGQSEQPWVQYDVIASMDQDDITHMRHLIAFYHGSGDVPAGVEAVQDQFYNGKSPYYSPKLLVTLQKKGEMIRDEKKLSHSEIYRRLIWAVGLGVCFDQFFNDQRFGVSVVVFLVLLLTAALAGPKPVKLKPMALVFGVASVVLALYFAIYNNETLRQLNTLLLPLSVTAFLLAVKEDAVCISFQAFRQLLKTIFIEPVVHAAKVMIPFKLLSAGDQPRKSSSGWQVAIGLLLSLPMVAILLPLLAKSDMVFSSYVKEWFTWDLAENWETFFWHSISSGLFFLYFFGYLWFMAKKQEPPLGERPATPLLSVITSSVFLGMILLVYTIFSYVQMRYLFAGATMPEGLTYSEYARRGFFELVTAACINAFLTLLLQTFTKTEGMGRNRQIQWMLSALVGFSYMLLVSGFYRMFLYEQAYGYTELRLFVQFFMAFMGIGFSMLAFWIWRPTVQLGRNVLIAAIAVYLCLNVINVDGLIAYKNLNHPNSTRALDEGHLSGLSVDAYATILKNGADHPLFETTLAEFIQNNTWRLEGTSAWYEFNINAEKFKRMQ